MIWAILIATAFLASACAPSAQPPPLPPPAPTSLTIKVGAVPASIPPGAARYAQQFVQVWQAYFQLTQAASVGMGQVHQESRWKGDARSAAGAQGMGQFMPSTASWIAGMLPADVRSHCPQASGCPLDPSWALQALVKFDRILWDGQADAENGRERAAMMLVGYNGGASWVSRERKAARDRSLAWRAWFGEGAVESVCLRSTGACTESRAYPRIILETWAPKYHAWLGI